MLKSRINFNPQQIQAISHGEGPVLVISGAGSGKTGVITHRVARLLSSGVPPERILCLTFTRKASQEMAERIESLTSSESVKKCFIGTFHAWGLIFLKKHASIFFPTSSFTLYDDNDRREALVNVLKDARIDFSGNIHRSYGEKISLAKNNLQQVDKSPEEIRAIYRLYDNFLTNRKACDFDDLLFIPYRILNSNTFLLEKYQNRYDYILVDEYQDTNRAQYALLQLIASVKPNIMAVGDDDQSIYSWRGAQIENILNFEKDFPDVTIIRLETNYRSSKNIIACANSLIINNRNRKEKKLIPTHPLGDKIHIFEASDPLTEAKKIVEFIQTRILREDCGYGDFAVLYRAKHQSKILKEIFSQSRIPYQAYGEIGFFDRKEIRDLLSFIKILLNPDDDISMLRVINLPRRIRESTLKKILNETIAQQETLYSFLKNLEHKPEKRDWLKASEKENLSVFIHFIDTYHSPKGKDTQNIFREFLDQVGYRQSLENVKENMNVKERREKNLEQFFEIMKKFFEKNYRSSLDAFLTRISMDWEEDKETSTMVSLLTMHAAKGLEFQHVFIVGFEENLIPFFKEGYLTLEEEERRLAYVALTRAKKTCSLSFCKTRKIQGNEIHNPPSRFLNEITSDYLIRNYGKNPEKPPAPTQKDRDLLRSKALDRMKALLQNNS